ncbi:MAG: DUF3575 domain-containing protein [Alistipes sp.]|nr:DUF3575 domain-containing protein [Alistipes sp.]
MMVLVAILSFYSVEAEERIVEHRLVVDIPFFLAGGREGDIRYDIDSIGLVNSLRDIELLNQDKSSTIKSVEFYSSVSPEGTVRFNKQLGKMRILTAENIVRQRLNIAESVAITYDERYIPWHDYLLPAIKADSTVPYRKELLKLIYRAPGTKGPDKRRVALKRTMNGKLWNVVKERYFDYIRKGGAIVTVERTVYGDITPTNSNAIVALQSVHAAKAAAFSFPSADEVAKTTSSDVKSEVTLDEKRKQELKPKRSDLAISVKTNILGWGLAIMNIAAEIDFAKHWSFSLPIYYSAHNYFTPTIKFRTLATQPELRYWFKEDNSGFFAGAHFGVASYNIAVDGNLRYQDHNGTTPALGGGISVGYRMPLSKNEKWNIEFVVGAGVYKLRYDTFYNVKNGRLAGTHSKTYWGIDNAAINISYRFDLKKQK